MDRASDSGSEGWGFESLPAYHIVLQPGTGWFPVLLCSIETGSSAKLKIFSRDRRNYNTSPVFRAISSRNGSSLLKQSGRFHGNGQDPVKRTLLGICRSHGLRPGVVQAEIIRPNAYTVSYVSDNAYSDGMQYPDFEEAVRACCPCRRLRLRHIRDVDGHFVTREEYRARVHQAKKR